MKGDFDLLLHIAEKAGLFGSFRCSTRDIAKVFDISQQSVSRKFRELENKGLIKRDVNFRGHTITLNEKGIELLKQKQDKLNRILSIKTKTLTGKIITGIGEGSYYVSQYQKQFLKELGFKPFPGTLNIRVNAKEAKEFLSSLNEIIIKAFKTKQRSFGFIKCYSIKINGRSAFAVLPERARHDENVIEIIAEKNLKQTLNLKDGDKIRCVR